MDSGVKRPRDITPRSCPICGQSDAAPPTACGLCKGTKLVDVATWSRWALRPPSRSTSTTISMRQIAGARVVEVREAGGPHAKALVQRGEGLIAIVDSWLEVPADGRERATHYQRINAWLAETGDYLRAERAKR